MDELAFASASVSDLPGFATLPDFAVGFFAGVVRAGVVRAGAGFAGAAGAGSGSGSGVGVVPTMPA